MDIGKRIRELRNAIGYTQKELAQKSGVATVSIQQYERGVRQPRIEQLKRIANALQAPLSDFVDAEPLTVNLLPKDAPDDTEGVNHFEHAVSFLESLGYALGLEIGDAGEELYYSITDMGNKKIYFLSEEEVATLTDNIGNYAKFILQEMLKEKTAFDTPYKIPPIRSLADLA